MTSYLTVEQDIFLTGIHLKIQLNELELNFLSIPRTKCAYTMRLALSSKLTAIYRDSLVNLKRLTVNNSSYYVISFDEIAKTLSQILNEDECYLKIFDSKLKLTYNMYATKVNGIFILESTLSED